MRLMLQRRDEETRGQDRDYQRFRPDLHTADRR